MSPVALHNYVDIIGRSKTRAYSDDKRGFVFARTQVPLGHNGVYDYIGFQLGDYPPGRVDNDPDFFAIPYPGKVGPVAHQLSDYPFDLHFPGEHGLAERDGPAHTQRALNFCHADAVNIGHKEPVGDA
jgi:hypothetical protein